MMYCATKDRVIFIYSNIRLLVLNKEIKENIKIHFNILRYDKNKMINFHIIPNHEMKF